MKSYNSDVTHFTQSKPVTGLRPATLKGSDVK
jgi:hypothetical protein